MQQHRPRKAWKPTADNMISLKKKQRTHEGTWWAKPMSREEFSAEAKKQQPMMTGDLLYGSSGFTE